jgi:O-antigen/teichoic acid export membrane protein
MSNRLNSTVVGSSLSARQTARWDAQNIFKNYFVLAGTQIGGAVFSLATVWIANRLYNTEGYGNIVAIIAGSQAIQLFTNWTNVALARYGVQEFVETGGISKTFWGRSAILTPNLILVASTAPLWAYWLLALLHLPTAAISFIILHFFFSVIWVHFQQALQAVKMPRVQGVLIFFERVLILLLVLFFGYVLKLSWLYAFYAFIIAAILMSIIAWWHIRHLISWRLKIDKEWIKKLLAFSLPLVPYSITSFFCSNYLDAFFITKYLSKSDLGIYFVGYQINSLILQFLIIVGSLLMPMFVTLRMKNQENFIKQYLEDLLPILTLIWGVLVSFAAIVFGYLIPLIFGNNFSQLDSIIWIFMVGTTFTVPSLIGYSPFATAASAVYIGFPLAIATATTNVVGNFIFIPKWGLVGSAWSTSISAVISMVSIILLIRVRFHFRNGFLFLSMVPCCIGLVFFLLERNSLYASLTSLLITLIILFIRREAMRRSILFLLQLKTLYIKR